jgi:hypothetical protein
MMRNRVDVLGAYDPSSFSFCSSPTTTVPTAMKPALSTLQAATTRARRSAPAHAWMAANDGTMNRPPEMASPARSMTMRSPCGVASSAPTPIGLVAGVSECVAQPRSSANRPSSTAPIAVGSRTMRPADIQAASPEPTAIATVKIAKNTVPTCSFVVPYRVHNEVLQILRIYHHARRWPKHL